MIVVIVVVILFIVLLVQMFRSKRMTRNTVICFTGGLGAGKTYIGTAKAVSFYRRQRLRYWLRFLPIIGNKNPPHLFSNIPIKLGRNRYSEILSLEHLTLQKRIPEKSIVFIDEIGQFANQFEFDNPYVMGYLQEFIRFFRHYIDGRLVLTDQASDNIVKPIRLRVNIIYNLSDFRRMWFVLPFYKVNVDELTCVEDTVQNVNIMSREDATDTEYFFGFLPYRFMKSFKRYDSRCYSIMYMAKKLFTAPKAWRKDLKTNYLINIDATDDERKLWKKTRIAPAIDPKRHERPEDEETSDKKPRVS